MITVTGKYLYTDNNVPAVISIGGQPCKVVSFNIRDKVNSEIVCQNSAVPSNLVSDFYGNRGITLIRENILTNVDNLAQATPSENAITSKISQASYQDINKVDVTIWMQGYFNPMKTSDYEISIQTNGNAVLYGGSSPSDTKLISSNTVNGTIALTSNQ